jgi:hypothetical protein
MPMWTDENCQFAATAGRVDTMVRMALCSKWLVIEWVAQPRNILSDLARRLIGVN